MPVWCLQKSFQPPLPLRHISQLPQPEQQRNVPQLQQTFPLNLSQEQCVPQHCEIDPQLYGTSQFAELEVSYDENALLNSQPEKTSVYEQAFAEEKGNDDQDLDEKSGSVLPNKEPNAIKSKLTRLINRYERIKKYNNQSGVEHKD
ncbi:unnamed protein product [Rhizophagus irregularis]|nr:unnamed protein product [Rhizophagus irregularis]